MVDLSVVIPTLCEAETAPQVVAEVIAATQLETEAIVVDDSPSDATVAAVGDEFGDDSRVCAIHRQGDGLASAVVQGWDIASGEIFAVIDGDGQHPPGRLALLAQAVEQGADIAVASRHASGGGVDGDWPAHRRLLSAGADRLARLAVPTARQLSDPMSGYFAVDADLVDAVRGQLRPAGYKILLELCARAPVQQIAEVPYVFEQRDAGSSNLGMREYIRYVRHLTRLTVPARRESVQVVAHGEVDV